MKKLLALGVLSAGLCGGCASTGGAAPAVEAPAAPFVAVQPEDARLSVAASDLTGRVGHDVGYEVDAGVLKEHGAHMPDALADALETISRVLERGRADDPALYAKVCATFMSLRIEIDEKAREHRAYLDGRALVLRVPTGAASFATDATITAALFSSD